MSNIVDQRALAETEYLKIKEWVIAEGKRRIAEFEKIGSFHGFTKELDIYRELFDEFQKKCLELYDKYDLPNKPKIEG